MPPLLSWYMDTVVIFHNVRSVHNVGSLFRTADAAGVHKVYLTGYTPAPIDRFGREVVALHKTALGAEKTVPWEKVEIKDVLDSLKDEGYAIVGVEQTPESKTYTSFSPSGKTAFVFGSEVEGLSREVLGMCDTVIDIPMHGEKESLNVSVTAGIILFHYIPESVGE